MLRVAARSLMPTAPSRLQLVKARRMYSEEGSERSVEPIQEHSAESGGETSIKPRPFTGINKAIILGTVGNTPKTVKLADGNVLASFSVATNSSYKDEKTGEWKKITEWHDIMVSNSNLSEYVGKFVTKGTRVYLEGTIRTKVSTDANGVQVRRKKIILGGKISDFQIVKYTDVSPEVAHEEEDDF